MYKILFVFNKMRKIHWMLLPTLVKANHGVVYWNPFIFILFPLMFYVMIIITSYSHVRPRFPFFLVFFAILFPPAFFIILLYISFFFIFPRRIEIVEIEQPPRHMTRV